MTVYTTGVRAALSSRHILPDGPPEERIEHTHDYVVEALIAGQDLDGKGYLIDIAVLRSRLVDVLDRYRGCLMNELAEFASSPPSMECLARQVWERLAPALDIGEATLTVRVWEDPTAWASFEGPCP